MMDLDALFALHREADGHWIAPAAPATDEKRLFGGVLIGQAIVAASWETRRCHSLHAYFIGVGAMERSFGVLTERTRDGGSFATRRFDIRQGDRLLLTGQSSHHDGDAGPHNQSTMPDLPPPEGLDDQREVRARRTDDARKSRRRYLADELFDIRPIELPADGAESRRAIWFRPRSPIRGGAAHHQAAIGFASDAGLVHVGLLTHNRQSGAEVQAASLDHAIWFHRDASANGWLLHMQHSATNASGRGLSRAKVFSRDGTLVASVAQEFLARYVDRS
jgi:acyl-CoA thioesterase-2